MAHSHSRHSSFSSFHSALLDSSPSSPPSPSVDVCADHTRPVNLATLGIELAMAITKYAFPGLVALGSPPSDQHERELARNLQKKERREQNSSDASSSCSSTSSSVSSLMTLFEPPTPSLSLSPSTSPSLSYSPPSIAETEATSIPETPTDVSEPAKVHQVKPFSKVLKRVSTLKSVLSKTSRKQSDEEQAHVVPVERWIPPPPPKYSLKGMKIVFAGAEHESAAEVASLLTDASLALTSIPTHHVGVHPRPITYHRDRNFQHTISDRAHAEKAAMEQMALLREKLDAPESFVHPGSSELELLHLAKLAGGVDALVVDLRSREGGHPEHTSSLGMVAGVAGALMPALTVPEAPALWETEDSMRWRRRCECGTGKAMKDACRRSHQSPLQPEGRVQQQHKKHQQPQIPEKKKLLRSLSFSNTTKPTQINHEQSSRGQGLKRVLTSGSLRRATSTPSPVSSASLTATCAMPQASHARIVVIADPKRRVHDAAVWLSDQQGRTGAQWVEKLLQRRTAPSPREAGRGSGRVGGRRYEPIGMSYRERLAGPPKEKPHRPTQDGVPRTRTTAEDIVPLKGRQVRAVVLAPELVDEFLQPALLGKLDGMYRICFSKTDAPQMRRFLAGV